MYKCNLCERSFSQRASLSRHYTQLHPYPNKHSRTLNWIENQRLDVPFQQKILQPLDNNNLWKEFEGLDNFSQDVELLSYFETEYNENITEEKKSENNEYESTIEK